VANRTATRPEDRAGRHTRTSSAGHPSAETGQLARSAAAKGGSPPLRPGHRLKSGSTGALSRADAAAGAGEGSSASSRRRGRRRPAMATEARRGRGRRTEISWFSRGSALESLEIWCAHGIGVGWDGRTLNGVG